MSTKPLGLRERNRIRTRDELLSAMSLLLGEQHFETITVDDVAQRAGVSRGTIYSYFPDGRDQLVRDAYLRIADQVGAAGAHAREQHLAPVERIVSLAEALSTAVETPEGRFYGLTGPGILGPLSGVTGTASRRFLAMLTEDLDEAKRAHHLPEHVPVAETAVLISGAIREIARVTATDPAQAAPLLGALRVTCEALIGSVER